MARTRIDQVFVSNTDRVLEATYVFPLPEGAAISEFVMTINGKRVQGELLERDKDRKIYEDIARRTYLRKLRGLIPLFLPIPAHPVGEAYRVIR